MAVPGARSAPRETGKQSRALRDVREEPLAVLEGMDASRAHSLQQPMDRRYIDRWQIALFGGLLGFTWWCRRASMNFERRLLRAGIWLTDAQKPRSR
jgi:hypothetical protein